MPDTITLPMNRVEGDLEIRVDVDAGVVTDAWSAGTMFRGFENLLIGRGALDGLVLTPRVCGMCSFCHLTAASCALDRITGVSPPPDAVRIRNVALGTEHLQSDLRHTFLLFAGDLVHPAYGDRLLYEEAVSRYAPFKGRVVREVFDETRSLLEIENILAGQWPHSSFMVPGGVVGVPTAGDLLGCRTLLKRYRSWYEQRVLGCSIERWQSIRTYDELIRWTEDDASHRDGEVGFLLRYGLDLGLERLGRGTSAFISVGGLELPDGTSVRGPHGGRFLLAAGFARGPHVSAFDESRIAEHVASSWFVDYAGGRHPATGETRPYATGDEGEKYSWAKAPRYDGLPAETGPLAEAVVAGDPLFLDMIVRHGPSVLSRQLARLVRGATLLPAMEAWLEEVSTDHPFYLPVDDVPDGEAVGLIEAARGALGHWVRIEKGRIAHYQIVTPTAWNASPRDSDRVRGPMEEALVGTECTDPANPVRVGHVVRSFDPCLVCTVHAVRRGTTVHRARVGATP